MNKPKTYLLRVDPKLHKAALTKAARRREHLSVVLRKALEQYVGKPNASQAA